MTEQLPTRNRGWSVTMAALGINLVLGVLYAWGVVGKVLSDPQGVWAWKKATAALPFTVSTAAFAITMIFAGRTADAPFRRGVSKKTPLFLPAGFVGRLHSVPHV